jgi:hypothetical protein
VIPTSECSAPNRVSSALGPGLRRMPALILGSDRSSPSPPSGSITRAPSRAPATCLPRSAPATATWLRSRRPPRRRTPATRNRQSHGVREIVGGNAQRSRVQLGGLNHHEAVFGPVVDQGAVGADTRTCRSCAFVESGVEAPIRDIAARAGVGTATIYQGPPVRGPLHIYFVKLRVPVCTRLLDAAHARRGRPVRGRHEELRLRLVPPGGTPDRRSPPTVRAFR